MTHEELANVERVPGKTTDSDEKDVRSGTSGETSRFCVKEDHVGWIDVARSRQPKTRPKFIPCSRDLEPAVDLIVDNAFAVGVARGSSAAWRRPLGGRLKGGWRR
jgi:hypothetical protein